MRIYFKKDRQIFGDEFDKIYLFHLMEDDRIIESIKIKSSEFSYSMLKTLLEEYKAPSHSGD